MTSSPNMASLARTTSKVVIFSVLFVRWIFASVTALTVFNAFLFIAVEGRVLCRELTLRDEASGGWKVDTGAAVHRAGG